MINFNKVLTSKIIFLIIAVSFLLVDISYAATSQQGYLRVPVGERSTYERVEEMMGGRGKAQPPAVARTGKENRKSMINKFTAIAASAGLLIGSAAVGQDYRALPREISVKNDFLVQDLAVFIQRSVFSVNLNHPEFGLIAYGGGEMYSNARSFRIYKDHVFFIYEEGEIRVRNVLIDNANIGELSEEVAVIFPTNGDSSAQKEFRDAVFSGNHMFAMEKVTTGTKTDYYLDTYDISDLSNLRLVSANLLFFRDQIPEGALRTFEPNLGGLVMSDSNHLLVNKGSQGIDKIGVDRPGLVSAHLETDRADLVYVHDGLVYVFDNRLQGEWARVKTWDITSETPQLLHESALDGIDAINNVTSYSPYLIATSGNELTILDNEGVIVSRSTVRYNATNVSIIGQTAFVMETSPIDELSMYLFDLSDVQNINLMMRRHLYTSGWRVEGQYWDSESKSRLVAEAAIYENAIWVLLYPFSNGLPSGPFKTVRWSNFHNPNTIPQFTKDGRIFGLMVKNSATPSLSPFVPGDAFYSFDEQGRQYSVNVNGQWRDGLDRNEDGRPIRIQYLFFWGGEGEGKIRVLFEYLDVATGKWVKLANERTFDIKSGFLKPGGASALNMPGRDARDSI